MAYDIFISYRRRGGFETAKHLYDLLTKDGYRVSFDIDTLRNGDFDTELLRRIDECRDFILILSEGALDLPQALAIFRRLAEKEPERYRARIAELEPLVRRNKRTFRLFTGLFLLFTIAFCVLLPAGLLYWIVRAGSAHNYPLMAAGVAVLGGVFALFVSLIRKNRSES